MKTPEFNIQSEIERVTAKQLSGVCPLCDNTGRIFIGISIYGDRMFDVCKCPSGDSTRRFIDREEQRLRQDELARDRRSERGSNW